MLKDIMNEKQSRDDIEIQKLLEQIQDCYDKIMILTLHKMYGVNAKLIDDEHVEIEGVVMDEQQFTDWLYDKEVELGHIKVEEPREPKKYDA